MVIYLGWGYVPGGDRAEVGQPCAGSFVSLLPFFFGIYGTRLVVRRVARSSHSRRERKRVERREKPKKKKNREEKSQQQRRRRRRRANNSSAESARWPPRWFLFLYYRPGAGSQATIPPESESIHSVTLPTGWSLPAIKLCVLGRFFFFHFFGIFLFRRFFCLTSFAHWNLLRWRRRNSNKKNRDWFSKVILHWNWNHCLS